MAKLHEHHIAFLESGPQQLDELHEKVILNGHSRET